MKTIIYRLLSPIIVPLVIFMLSGCQESKDVHISKEVYDQGSAGQFPNRPVQYMIRNQLVVKFKSGTSEDEKQQVRSRYKVADIKQCHCADESLELWIFGADLPGGGVEEIKGEASSEPDLEGVDFQYVFDQPASNVATNASAIHQLENLMVSANDGVTVAIIDSGLDFGYEGFDRQFLYNSRAADDHCVEGELEELSGWDFVSQDNLPEDTHGHGTVVTSIIEKELREQGVPFQVLPVRSFNGEGKGTYFDILCGFRYASLKQDVDVINMSFGWYLEMFELLPQFISEVEQRVLLISSSGNQGVNTDDLPHYPSGYLHSNLLSVGGADSAEEDLSWFSNYGMNSVDLVAASQDIPFVTGSTTVYVEGTSFSTAIVTARAVKLFESSYGPAMQIQWIANHGVYKSALDGKVSYGVLLEP